MLFSSLVILSAATSVLASPIERDTKLTLPLKRLSQAKSLNELIKQGKARINRANKDSAPLENVANSYLANVTVGAGTYQLIVDTGSSNTWVGAGSAYQPGPNSHDTGNQVEVGYGSGAFLGEEYIDTVSVGSATVKAQSIGAALFAEGFANVDGILGVGPVSLTHNTVENEATVPTFIHNLVLSKAISNEILGVYFTPEKGSDNNDVNGELTFGGVDSAKYTGDITYTSLQTTGAAAPYWGIAGSFKYDGKTLGSTSAGIVDTGTTLIYLPTSSFQAFLKASNGRATGAFATYTTKPTAKLTFTIGTNDYDLTPEQYLIPFDQYANIGITDTSKYYAWIGDGGNGQDAHGRPVPDAVIGQKFLEHYYSVFDTTNSRVGFAKAV